jgi:hypothetical protein
MTAQAAVEPDLCAATHENETFLRQSYFRSGLWTRV